MQKFWGKCKFIKKLSFFGKAAGALKKDSMDLGPLLCYSDLNLVRTFHLSPTPLSEPYAPDYSQGLCLNHS